MYDLFKPIEGYPTSPDWWERGEDTCRRLYDGLMEDLVESDNPLDWTDDSAAWFEVIDEDYDLLVNTDLTHEELFDMADYLNHFDDTDRPVYHKLAVWMCVHHEKESAKAKEDAAVNDRPKLREVPRHEPGVKMPRAWNDLQYLNDTDEFNVRGDYYACYEMEDSDQYAVYLHSSGMLLCLLGDCSIALVLCMDDEFEVKRYDLYHQMAINAGFPEHIDTGMTWRQVIEHLGSFDDKFLDTTAYVAYTPDGDLEQVSSVKPWYFTYGSGFPGPDEDNVLYLDLMRNGN